MKLIMKWLVRLVLLIAGLVFAGALTLGLGVLLLGWSLRTGWAKLTGRPVAPFAMRMNLRSGLGRMHRFDEHASNSNSNSSNGSSRTPRAGAMGTGRLVRPLSVTDVEARPPQQG